MLLPATESSARKQYHSTDIRTISLSGQHAWRYFDAPRILASEPPVAGLEACNNQPKAHKTEDDRQGTYRVVRTSERHIAGDIRVLVVAPVPLKHVNEVSRRTGQVGGASGLGEVDIDGAVFLPSVEQVSAILRAQQTYISLLRL